jgi:hypothetical protein
MKIPGSIEDILANNRLKTLHFFLLQILGALINRVREYKPSSYIIPVRAFCSNVLLNYYFRLSEYTIFHFYSKLVYNNSCNH